jgi:hypothetical protein
MTRTLQYMIEGEWTGYRSEQQRIVHRHFTTDAEEARKIEEMRAIHYTDGTQLLLTVTKLINVGDATPKAMDGYGLLIQKCLAAGVNEVAKLPKAKVPAVPPAMQPLKERLEKAVEELHADEWSEPQP